MYHCMYIYDVYIFFYPFESVIFETVGMQMPFARSLENDTFKRVNELDFISQSQILQKKLFLVNMRSMCQYILSISYFLTMASKRHMINQNTNISFI